MKNKNNRPLIQAKIYFPHERLHLAAKIRAHHFEIRNRDDLMIDDFRFQITEIVSDHPLIVHAVECKLHSDRKVFVVEDYQEKENKMRLGRGMREH